jgi:hypothetical protein
VEQAPAATPSTYYEGDCPEQWPQSNPRTFSANYRATLRSDFFQIVREAEFQPALQRQHIRLGGHTRGRAATVFCIRRDGSSAGDHFPVKVTLLDGSLVGYLSQRDARSYQRALELLEPQYDRIWCQGLIETTNKPDGSVKASLDLATPTQCIERAGRGDQEGGITRR